MLPEISLTPEIRVDKAPDTAPPTTGIIPEIAYFAPRSARPSFAEAISVWHPTVDKRIVENAPIRILNMLLAPRPTDCEMAPVSKDDTRDRAKIRLATGRMLRESAPDIIPSDILIPEADVAATVPNEPIAASEVNAGIARENISEAPVIPEATYSIRPLNLEKTGKHSIKKVKDGS